MNYLFDVRNPITRQRSMSYLCAICMMWAKLTVVCINVKNPVTGKGSMSCMWSIYDASQVMYELYVWCKEPSYWKREYQLCVCAICLMWAQLPGWGLIVLPVNYMFDVRSPVTGWGKYELCECAICMIWAQLPDHGAAVVCMNYRFDVRSPVTGQGSISCVYVLYVWCEPSYWPRD